ncbi:hypothetical protein H4R33_001010 [Dimargaris cristalligena]|uniref:Protein FAM72 n=1 Tax=Dimargaris cristalligena TaxID=215637 RepID=A0A4P9ZV18_9FUNG|nr:hypothetical protein H4R33_001010 [Dimargaris cristalligena]RKP36761.1 protein FAM72 [Dimargaris cristalligena]|eukprot:RKP36761.1 protein FAM72 [Dimargaris cristalligena]
MPPTLYDYYQDHSRQQFRGKAVCQLNCALCDVLVCMRGMRALLLADNRIELYSTDVPPYMVQLVGDDYTTPSCRCKIRNIACLGCGTELGYHITQPCGGCMKACNNGHFWMFRTETVLAQERLDDTGNYPFIYPYTCAHMLDFHEP